MRTNGRGFESVLPRLNPLVKQDRILGGDSGSNNVQDVGPGGGGWWPSDDLLGNIRSAPHPVRFNLHPAPMSSFRPPALLDTLDYPSLNPISWSPSFSPRSAIPHVTTHSPPRLYHLLLSLLCQGRPPCYPTSPPLPNKSNSLECV